MADVIEEIVEYEMMGINTVGAWGEQQGFTIVNFIFCYLIGVYLKNIEA